MPNRKRIYRLTLNSLTLFFPPWFLFLSNIFGWGYTPIPRLLATTIVAVLIPTLLLLDRTIPAILTAAAFSLLTWPPLIFVWRQTLDSLQYV